MKVAMEEYRLEWMVASIHTSYVLKSAEMSNGTGNSIA